MFISSFMPGALARILVRILFDLRSTEVTQVCQTDSDRTLLFEHAMKVTGNHLAHLRFRHHSDVSGQTRSADWFVFSELCDDLEAQS